jgi:tetratricopeptide (TPR) repeat protein
LVHDTAPSAPNGNEPDLPPDLASRLDEATRQHMAGRTADAERLYLEIIQRRPQAAEPRRRLGVLYGQTGRHAQAIDHIAAAARLAPRAEYFQDLGQTYLMAQRVDDAVAAFRRAVALDPAAVPPRVALGTVLQQTGAAAEAIGHLQEAAALAPGAFAAHYNLGVALAAEGRADEAIAAYRQALMIEPNSPAALANLGIVLKEEKKFDEAIDCYRRALAAAPDIPSLHSNLAVALRQTGELRAALAAIRRATELDPQDAQSLLLRAHLEIHLEEWAAAEQSLRRLLELDPGHTMARSLWAVALQQVGKTDEARHLLDFPARLRLRHLDQVPGFASIEAFNAALIEEIRSHPTLVYEPVEQSTRGGSQTRQVFDRTDGAFGALRQIVVAALTDYIATGGLPGLRPTNWHLVGWAVVLKSAGYQEPHIHARSVLSGVYYVRVPKVVQAGGAGEAGYIRFGDPGTTLAHGRRVEGLHTAALKPEEGLMVLFPAYFFHSTVPFESDEERICVAFDAMPV